MTQFGIIQINVSPFTYLLHILELATMKEFVRQSTYSLLVFPDKNRKWPVYSLKYHYKKQQLYNTNFRGISFYCEAYGS